MASGPVRYATEIAARPLATSCSRGGWIVPLACETLVVLSSNVSKRLGLEDRVGVSGELEVKTLQTGLTYEIQ